MLEALTHAHRLHGGKMKPSTTRSLGTDKQQVEPAEIKGSGPQVLEK